MTTPFLAVIYITRVKILFKRFPPFIIIEDFYLQTYLRSLSLCENKHDKKIAIEDGSELKFYTLDELIKGELSLNSIIIQGKKYPLVPTISFSIACLLSSL